jgi:anti-anti-sigma regulatory factor
MTPRRGPQFKLIETQPVGGAIVARLIGPSILQDSELEAVGQQLGELVARGVKRVALDMGALAAMSTGLLTKLLTFQATLKAAGGRLALFSVPPQIYEIFEVTRLNTKFNLYVTEFEALESF